MRKIKRGGGPGGSSEWILEEKGQPRGKCQGPEWASQAWWSLGHKEQKGQSQRVGRLSGEQPLLSASVGESRIAGENRRHRRETSDTPRGRWVAAVCCLGETWVSPVYAQNLNR